MSLKYTFMYSVVTPGVGGEGFSESWYSSEAQYTPNSRQDALDYLKLRLMFSGVQTYATHVRISTIETIRKVLVISLASEPGFKNQGVGRLGADKNLDSDFASTAFLMRKFAFGSATWGFTYVRGICDDFVDRGGSYDPTAAMTAAFIAWKNKIVGLHWGWMGSDGVATKSSRIVQVAQDQGNRCNISTQDPAFFPAPLFGKKVRLTISGATGMPTLNGVRTYNVVNATVAVSTAGLTVGNYNALSATVTSKSKGIIQMTDAAIDRVVERKSGRPLYQSAGRRRKIVRG